jgi:hypothetical protein
MEKKYQTFKEFYPFYLSEHSHPTNRLMHFIGTSIALTLLINAIFFKMWILGILAIVSGYAFAWIGHFIIEKNRPATFTYPLYSFVGDWKMFYEILTLQRGLKD